MLKPGKQITCNKSLSTQHVYRNRKAGFWCVVSIILLSLTGHSQADGFDSENHLTGDWGGFRKNLADQGVSIRLGHFSQSAYNLKGGASSQIAYADQFFFGGYIDLETLLGWSGAKFKVEITNRNGDLINNKAEMPFLLQSQQIFGRGNVTRLTQFSLTQNLFEEKLRIKLGRIYPSADFFAMSCAFQHLTFCSGGSSNYISSSWYGDPLSALGAQLTYQVTNNLHFKAGAYDANPQVMSLDQGLKLNTPGNTRGTTIVSEIEYTTTIGNNLKGEYRVGMVRSSLDKPKLVNSSGFPAGTTDDAISLQDTDNAHYFNIEQQLTSNSAGGGLNFFANMIFPDSSINAVGKVLAVGVFVNAPFPGRPKDRLGFAIGRNSVSKTLRQAQRQHNTILSSNRHIVREHEYPIELNYNYAVTPAVEVMPSIQYVIHPNGDKQADDAIIVGLQLSLNF